MSAPAKKKSRRVSPAQARALTALMDGALWGKDLRKKLIGPPRANTLTLSVLERQGVISRVWDQGRCDELFTLLYKFVRRGGPPIEQPHPMAFKPESPCSDCGCIWARPTVDTSKDDMPIGAACAHCGAEVVSADRSSVGVEL